MRYLLLGVVILWASVVSAQPTPSPPLSPWLRMAVAGSIAADTSATLTCLQRQTCYEANPMLAWAQHRPALMIAASTAQAVGTDRALVGLSRQHPRAARVLASVILCTRGYLAVRAWRAPRRP